jgi:hypothetical protein
MYILVFNYLISINLFKKEASAKKIKKQTLSLNIKYLMLIFEKKLQIKILKIILRSVHNMLIFSVHDKKFEKKHKVIT